VCFVSALLLAAAAVPAIAAHASYRPKPGHPCKTGYQRDVKRKHRRKVVECVWVGTKKTKKPSTGPTGTTGSSTPGSTATPPPAVVHASTDPSYALAVTAPQPPPIPVTFTYSAADQSGGPLPAGELTLQIYVHASVSAAGGCEANVGGATTSASCTLTLPAWGSYDLITSYSSGVGNVAATGETDTLNIEPPALGPTTATSSWPGDTPTLTAVVSGQTAQVALTDSQFGGVAHVGISDQLGESCEATVSGQAATCTLALTGQPTSFTVSYPGGQSIGEQTVSPWGVPQQHQVTTTWEASMPTLAGKVTGTYTPPPSATVVWQGGAIINADNSSTDHWSTGPWPYLPAPITLTLGQSVELGAYAEGSLASDPIGAGSIAYTVSPDDGSLTDEQPSASTNCAASADYVGDAFGECRFTPSEDGTYTFQTSYTSTDPNYLSVTGPSITIDVSG
jgi:hypothetical protein